MTKNHPGFGGFNPGDLIGMRLAFILPHINGYNPSESGGKFGVDIIEMGNSL